MNTTATRNSTPTFDLEECERDLAFLTSRSSWLGHPDDIPKPSNTLPPAYLFDPFLENSAYQDLDLMNSDWTDCPASRGIVAELERHGMSANEVAILKFGDHLAILSCAIPIHGPAWHIVDANDFTCSDRAGLAQIIAALKLRRFRKRIIDTAYAQDDVPAPAWASAITRGAKRILDILNVDIVEAWQRPRDWDHWWLSPANVEECAWPEFDLAREQIGMEPPCDDLQCTAQGYWAKISGHLARGVFLRQTNGTVLDIEIDHVPETLVTAAVGRKLGDTFAVNGTPVAQVFDDCRIVDASFNQEPEWLAPTLRLHLDDPVEAIAPVPAAIADKMGLPTSVKTPWWLEPCLPGLRP